MTNKKLGLMLIGLSICICIAGEVILGILFGIAGIYSLLTKYNIIYTGEYNDYGYREEEE